MAEYARQKADAERLYEQGSWTKAKEAYAAVDVKALPAGDAKWVAFRLLDCEWRNLASSSNRDNSKTEAVRTKLEESIAKVERDEDKDRVWVETQESLGDFYWIHNNYRNWYQGWQHYAIALDWWAGANVEVELARKRYLSICWKAVKPPETDSYYYYGYYGNNLPLDVLENVLTIAKSDDDKAQAHFLIAMTLKNQGGDWEQVARVPEEFEAALTLGKKTDWYDDALFNFAQYLESNGRAKQLPNGGWTRDLDYVGALALYQRFLREFKKGESRWYDQAKNQADSITRGQLSVGVSNVFLPDSLIPYYVSWRNVDRIDFTLSQVSLTDDVNLGKEDGSGSYLEKLDLSKAKTVKKWSKEGLDKKDYKPGNAQERMDALPIGAYVIEVTGGKDEKGKTLHARELILVTDVTVVVKSAPSKIMLWVTDAERGKPVPKASTTLLQRVYRGGAYSWRRRTMITEANGLAIYPRTKENPDESDNDLFAAAAMGDRQAFATGYAPSQNNASREWRIYAYTDRPAYRPGDEAKWKILAREYDGAIYTTPANKAVEWEIRDPQGSKVAEGKSTLNAFGSAWGDLKLTEKMPLGEYQIQFWTAGRKNGIGGAALLRLEEYKLPEFTVSVKTPEDEGGRRKTYRLGEKVTAEIQVDYYFGGAVADADVQLFVYQNYFWNWWAPPRDYPWFFEDMQPNRPYWYGNGGSVIKQEKVKTDAEGKATITFDTPRGGQQDLEYRIEARVTDSSRREVTGSGSVRVTNQKFYAYLTPKHSLYKPKDKVTVDAKTLDANGEPYPVEGKVAITRDRWWEIWLDPKGKEVKGEALEKLRREKPDFASHGYTFKFRGYQHDEIETKTIKTDKDGSAEITFTPDKDGYYQLEWVTPEKGRNPVKAYTWVWVATEATTELGYRHGGIEILLDQDTVKPGATTPVMLHVPTNDRWVLFTVGAHDLYHYEVVHMEGTVKLLNLKIEDSFVPNIFLDASMVQDHQLFTDEKQVVVPPIKHFLTVTAEPDKKEYQARDEGTWTITTRDDTGKAVSAEVGVGVIDESVYAIQEDLAGDPRQFYFGTKRGNELQTTATFNQKSYAKVSPTPVTPTETSPIGPQGNESLDRDQMNDGLMAADAPSPVLAEAAASGAVASKAVAGPGGGGRMRKESDEKQKSGKKDESHAHEMPPPPPKTPANGGGGSEEPVVVVRTDFRATAFWQNDVVTDADGHARVTLKYPDSLTAWRATARAATAGSAFGIAKGTARTRLPLLVRLQGPRFFVVGDSTLVSGVVNNNTTAPMSVSVELEASGVDVREILVKGKKSDGKVTVPPGGDVRVDFRVEVKKAGPATLKVIAKSSSFADAMEKNFEVFEHGVDKLVAKSGKMRGDGVKVKLELPKARREGSTELTVQVSPSIAVTMLDALPYLIDYPYGCTEQTMSRFLPAVIVRKTLGDLGLDPRKVQDRMFGGIEQAFLDKTHPDQKGKPAKKDLGDLDDMTREGLKRLYDFQHGDGGWGWWKEGSSDRFMSAYVLWGMAMARDAGIDVKSDVMNRAGDYLAKELVSEEANPDRQTWILNALSAWRSTGKAKSQPGAFEKKAIEHLWKDHTRMNAYTRSLFALSLWRYGETEKAKTLAQNLENGVQRDRTPDTSVVMEGEQSSDASKMATAHWGEDGFWWRWSDSPIETTSFALMAISQIDPGSPLVEQSMNWLVKNRRGAQWSNTKDTAVAVLALTSYLKATKEIGGELEYALTVNGKEVVKKKISKEEALGAPSRFAVDPKWITESNEISLKRISGKGPLYFSAEARFFSLEEPVTPAGNEMFVRRKYFKKQGRKSLLKGWVYDRLPLEDGGKVNSGDRIEVVITVETKNDYEYLLFEDLKPAGFEAVEVKSGGNAYARAIKQSSFERNYGKLGEDAKRGTAEGLGASTDEIDYLGDTQGVYQELRDRKVALFVDKLKQGIWEIRYELRAEVPGNFHGLPVLGHAMYVPEIRCNGREVRVEVLDREPGS